MMKQGIGERKIKVRPRGAPLIIMAYGTLFRESDKNRLSGTQSVIEARCADWTFAPLTQGEAQRERERERERERRKGGSRSEETVKDVSGQLLKGVEVRKRWPEYFESLLNVEDDREADIVAVEGVASK